MFKLTLMKIYLLAGPLLLLAACNSAPTQNAVVQDVAANNMIADEVTEVPDDSAAAPSENGAPAATTDQEHKDDKTVKKVRVEH